MRGEEEREVTKRIEVAQAPAPLEAYAEHFDPVFSKSNQREGFRHYLAHFQRSCYQGQDSNIAGSSIFILPLVLHEECVSTIQLAR